MTASPTTPATGVVERWIRVLRRRWRVGAALFLSVTALAAALLFLTKPVWRAAASLRLGAPPPLGGVSLGGGSSPAGLFTLFQQMTGDPFANELELLSSRTVVEGVVADNALNVTLIAPRGWSRDSLFASLSADSATAKAVYEATWRPDHTIGLRRTAPEDSLVGTVAPGQAVSFGGVTAVFLAWRPGMPHSVRLRTIPFGDAVRRTKGKLNATRERREANLVQISYDDPDPGLALRVVESAAARYTALRAELQRRESGETVDSLRDVARQTAAELRSAEDGLERFQRESGLLSPEIQGEAFFKRQMEVQGSLAKAQHELALVDDVVRRLAAVKDPATAWAGLVAHPIFLENRTLGDLLTNLVHLEQQRIERAQHRTAEDRTLQALDSQIAYLDGSLRTLVGQYRDGIAQQVTQLAGEAAGLDSTLARTPADAIELGRRERNLRLLSEVYLFTDQRLRQETLKDAISFSSIQVVDRPEVLFKPVWPRKKLGLAVAMLLAGSFAALAMATMERADRGVRTATEIRALTGAPVLAALTRERDGAVVVSAAERRALLGRSDGGPPRVVVLAPVDADPEAARAVARALSAAPASAVLAGAAGSPPRIQDPPTGGANPWPDSPIPGTNGNGSSPVGTPVAAGTRGEPLVALDAARRPTPSEPQGGAVAGPPVRSYAAAAEVAGTGADVLLVVRYGASHADDVTRAARLLGEAGVEPAGVVVVCADARTASEEVWS